MRLEQLDMLAGISPLNELLASIKLCSLRRWPISGGISSVSEAIVA